jgi:nucleotide-binding universal stress UspA family protein
LSLLIVGDNGREEGRDAVALAGLLAPLLGAELTRVRVVSEGQESDDPAAGDQPAKGEAPAAEIRVGDSAARVLHELAESRGAAMLVIGAIRRAGVAHILPTGVGERLLQGGPCPIAVAPHGYAQQTPAEPRVIGIAFDDSPESHGALELAIRLGRSASAALRVISVHAGPPPPSGALQDRSTAYEQLQQALREAVQPLPSELRAEPRFRSGDPATTLIAESELGLDLLLMGSRGYGPVRSVLLGSVSEAVVRGAPCPVIVVPRGGAESHG